MNINNFTLPHQLDNVNKQVLLFEKENTYFLKGICMILILIHHLYQHLVFSYNYGGDSFGCRILLSCGYLATGVFFMLSGYGLEKSFSKKEINKTLIVRNLKKLIFPYLYACLIYVIITQEFSAFGSGWFYKTILVIYLISFIVYKWVKSPFRRVLVFLILAIIDILIVYGFRFRVLPIYYANSIICFPLGTFLASVSTDKLNQIKRFLFPLIAVFAIIYYFSLSWYYGCTLDLLAAPIAAIIAIIICSYITKYSKCLLYVGYNSLLFYVLQITFLEPLEIIKIPTLYCAAVTVCIIIFTLIYTSSSRIISKISNSHV